MPILASVSTRFPLRPRPLQRAFRFEYPVFASRGVLQASERMPSASDQIEALSWSAALAGNFARQLFTAHGHSCHYFFISFSAKVGYARAHKRRIGYIVPKRLGRLFLIALPNSRMVQDFSSQRPYDRRAHPPFVPRG